MRTAAGFATAAIALLTGMAAAAEGIGEAKAVIDQASASGQVGDRVLAVGSAVFLGDEVKTDAQGEAQLLFSDGTRMVVGPNSSLVIDEFVFRAGSQENTFAVRALGGTFRFISGEQKPKDGYVIHTPAATIGVRGTTLDFTVEPSNTDMVLLEIDDPEQPTTVCAPGAECETVHEVCDYVSADRNEGVDVFKDEERRAEKAAGRFPFLEQERLNEEFRVEDDEGKECIALLLPAQAAAATTGAVAGPGLPVIAGPLGLGIIAGVAIGVLGQGGSSTSTTSTVQ